MSAATEPSLAFVPIARTVSPTLSELTVLSTLFDTVVDPDAFTVVVVPSASLTTIVPADTLETVPVGEAAAFAPLSARYHRRPDHRLGPDRRRRVDRISPPPGGPPLASVGGFGVCVRPALRAGRADVADARRSHRRAGFGADDEDAVTDPATAATVTVFELVTRVLLEVDDLDARVRSGVLHRQRAAVDRGDRPGPVPSRFARRRRRIRTPVPWNRWLPGRRRFPSWQRPRSTTTCRQGLGAEETAATSTIAPTVDARHDPRRSVLS